MKYKIHNIINVESDIQLDRLPAYFKTDSLDEPVHLSIQKKNFCLTKLDRLGLRLFFSPVHPSLIHKCLSYGDLKLKLSLSKVQSKVQYTPLYAKFRFNYLREIA